MTPAPKRRWFRFSLRTLFVVMTVFACWLGYEINWIRQRHIVVGDTQVQTARYYLGVWIDSKTRQSHSRRIYSVAPWPLNWLGEPGYWGVALKQGTSDDEVARVRRLFPEAEAVVVVDERSVEGSSAAR